MNISAKGCGARFLCNYWASSAVSSAWNVDLGVGAFKSTGRLRAEWSRCRCVQRRCCRGACCRCWRRLRLWDEWQRPCNRTAVWCYLLPLSYYDWCIDVCSCMTRWRVCDDVGVACVRQMSPSLSLSQRRRSLFSSRSGTSAVCT